MSSDLQNNRGKTLQWLEGDEQMFCKIKTLFLKNIPGQVALLKEYLDAGENSSAAMTAHKIMGSSAMLGASSMSNEAEKIELSSSEGDIDSARLHFARFVGEYEKIMLELAEDGGNI